MIPILLAGGGGRVVHHVPTLRPAPPPREPKGRTGIQRGRPHFCRDCGQRGSSCGGTGLHGVERVRERGRRNSRTVRSRERNRRAQRAWRDRQRAASSPP